MAVALLHRWVRSIARTYLGAATFAGAYGPVLLDLFAVAALWLWCWWLYRRRIFLRI
jgi:predicted acyltransferase